MGMLDCINEFVDTMIQEKSQFDSLQSEVNNRENDVLQVLKNLEKNEQNIVNHLREQIAESNDENMQEIFQKTSQSLFDTIKDANAKIIEAMKGMTFIHDFEKHFTVSVFGKVKAGKSYIGNFVMGHPIRKAGIESAYDKLEDLTVHVYDRGKLYEQNKLNTMEEEKECNGEEFYVNKSEATSTIQWVDIGGMCWFDTPGIGSVTLENEELAKASREDAQDAQKYAIILLVIIDSLLVIFIVVTGIITLMNIRIPLKEMVEATKELAVGKLDVTNAPRIKKRF